MAGHSHWANIAHKKGRIDKKRGALFGKLSRAIIVAARNGGADVDTNLRLRYAIDKAKKASMPKDNIEKAVKKGAGDLDGEQLVEILYEGYGPGGVAVLVEALTENRNRTAGEVRNLFDANGGNLGASNSVSWMFDKKGVVEVPAEAVDEETLFEAAVEAGADDVQLDGTSAGSSASRPRSRRSLRQSPSWPSRSRPSWRWCRRTPSPSTATTRRSCSRCSTGSRRTRTCRT